MVFTPWQQWVTPAYLTLASAAVSYLYLIMCNHILTPLEAERPHCPCLPGLTQSQGPSSVKAILECSLRLCLHLQCLHPSVVRIGCRNAQGFLLLRGQTPEGWAFWLQEEVDLDSSWGDHKAGPARQLGPRPTSEQGGPYLPQHLRTPEQGPRLSPDPTKCPPHVSPVLCQVGVGSGSERVDLLSNGMNEAKGVGWVIWVWLCLADPCSCHHCLLSD